MLAAVGLLALLTTGFALSGLLGNDDTSDTASDAPSDDGADTGDSADTAPAGSLLANFLFEDDTDPDQHQGERPGEAVVQGEVIVGGDTDDTIAGGDLNDVLHGRAGHDVLDGKAGHDTVFGDAGEDHLLLGPSDTGTGGADSDMFEIAATIELPDGEVVAKVTDFQQGVDRLILDFDGTVSEAPVITFDTETSPGDTLVMANGVAVTMLQGMSAMNLSDIYVQMSDFDPAEPGAQIEGTDGDDTLQGGDGNDTIDGYAGDDLLDGGTGDDLLRGREGMDSLFGDGGNDAITGGIGDDQLSGGAQNDILFGNEGHDALSGDGGADELYGDEGRDTLSGGDGTDFLAGGDGADVLSGGADGDLLFGNDGDDSLSGDAGDDYLQGGFGADTLDGGAGNDRLDGTFARGDSLFGPFDEDTGDTLIGGDGDDTIVLGANDIAMGGAGADTFLSGAYIETAELAGLVQDFDPTQDRIEVMYDPDVTPDPEITVLDLADGSGSAVFLEGTMVLRVSGAQGLDAAAIQLREIQIDPQAETA